MRPLIIGLVAGTMVLAAGHSLGADRETAAYDYLLNLSMDELTQVPIHSSGLFDMSWEQAPGLNYVVSTDLLDRFDIRSLTEYLNYVQPAFATVIHGTQGTTAGVRGILIDNTSKTLLLRDNLNMNNRFFVGINGSELSSPLLGDIDRVEVSAGPGALQHGSGAINGYLNMISATGKSKEGARMHTSYGSGDAKVVEASYGRVLSDKANLFFYGGYDQSNGVRPDYTFPAASWSTLQFPVGGANGINGTPSDTFLDSVRVGATDDDYKFSFRGQYGRETDSFQLDFKALRSHTSNNDPALGYYLGPNANWSEEVKLAADSNRGRYSPFYLQVADNLLLSPEMKFHLNAANDIKVIPYYQTIKTSSTFSPFLRDEVARLNVALADKSNCPALSCDDEYTYGDELHLGTTLIHTYSGIKNQTIAWGGEVKYFEFQTNPWYWTTVGIFAEDQLHVGAFTILPGLRYDRTSFAERIATVPPYNNGPYDAPGDEGALTKRLAIAYAIDTQQTAKLSYQEGFRFADAWPQQWSAVPIPAWGKTSQQIHSEFSDHYEANYSHLGLLDKRLNLLATLFYNIYSDTIGWDTAKFAWSNSPTTITSVGGELTIQFHPTETWDSGISYSYARPVHSYEQSIKVANDDNTWTRYPVHMVKVHLGHEVVKDLFVGGVGVVESPRYEEAGTIDPQVVDLFDRWSFVMSANAWYLLNKNLKISLSAKELLHANYSQIPAYYQGTRPLDSPRANAPQYYLSLDYAL